MGFGVEIECYLPEGSTMAQAAHAVSQRIGEPVNTETYNHSRRLSWKVVTDGSLGDYSRGCEFVSPVLEGEAGLAQVGAVCDALTDFGATVNKKCGLHAHVGVGGRPGIEFFRAMVKLYASFEPVIDAMMPPSRRASNNTFCRSMTVASAAAVDRATSIDELVRLVGNGRYAKVNLQAYARHQTVEFRQHSGTIDGHKATMWVRLCLKMVAAALRGVSITAAAGSVNRARRGSKAWQVGEMMMRPEGVSGLEVMAALNWPSVSLPQQARACGLTFTTQRMGREVRYFARASVASVTPTAITLDGFAATIGASDDERQYMVRRTSNLAGSIAWAA